MRIYPTASTAKLIVFTAPSGAGKTTLVRHILATLPHKVAFSVSATTRKQRSNEVNGKDYYFITREEFFQKRQNKEFLEWQEVYDGNFYGTLLSEIDRITQMGKAVIFDVDVEGALNIKKIFGNQALTVFVKPPSVAIIRQRLRHRNSETSEMLEKRVEKAVLELQYENRFDLSLLNDDITEAKRNATTIVTQFLEEER
ncbi:MAG TPA: guanylate kinase [Chitinophagales bacterium]|nr:guanylate kinase [Chitinophagales bacterium]HRK28588.1 guanylate kinase [Chitinophagales bacterium]